MSPAAIRAWASENGVECNAKGFLPKAVTEAYKAANGG
ncbi:histone-like nucleoid-structuring protein Lsr2 [Glycomyces mayteni]|uniref:Histone-like nucleoid-structuring protein Lsr2 n=1 Tax=Glycomyces mayteni TaxID=543887 RepID=A0ABW2D1B8_9ACTN